MLTFDLNTIKQYDGTSNSLVSTLSSTANSILPGAGALIDGVHNLLGGVDYAKDVEPVIQERIKQRLDHVQSVLSNTSISEAQRLTQADALLMSYIDWAIYTKATKKSAAWNKGYDLQINTLKEVLNNLRATYSASYNIDTSVKDAKPLGLVWFGSGNPFKYKKGSMLAYGVYTKKSIVQSVSGGLQGKPIASIPTTNIIPDIIEGGETTTKTSTTSDEKKPNIILAVVVAIVATVVGSVIYLFKKKNKKRK